ncbi:uncharacterized protein UBRO_00587 [Ustilago bromivora]|uniref:Uncharacterized protein n=1 Tax=Ustilago bromivora TaxID=307758 RepID=A0A1K0FX79_9BASI|nr:uncharacterized protein UBRO_00587 [Ustilago bromivora]SYW85086.1 uncharacterized protein UBRO2_05694 [Ustilago bromivora]
MTRRVREDQDENTPLLRHHNTDDGQGRWSLARRRSSAFPSLFSQPEDKDGEDYLQHQRKNDLYLVVFVNVVYNVAIGIMNSFFVELIQTLSCAEYYYDSSSPDSRFPTLPTTGDPSDFRRAVTIGAVVVAVLHATTMALLPTHYSFDPAVASTSTVHPTVSLYLLLTTLVVGGLLGAPQTAMSVLSQVMALDVCKEDEKTAAFSKVFASMTFGMAISSTVLQFLPLFNVHFGILHHTGPFSPFYMVVGVHLVALIIVILLLPETKPIPSPQNLSRRTSVSSDEDSQEHFGGSDRQVLVSSSDPPSSTSSGIAQSLKEMLGLFGYLIPYQPHPGSKRDYKLPLMLCGLVFCDTISMVWSNLVVFCSTHLHFGPQEVTILLGVIGATKGLYALFALPLIVTFVRKTVKKKIREELTASASIEDLSTETRLAKREESVILTDKIVALGSLVCDCAGFIAMGVAASHLSAAGIYGIPSIQALNVDFFLAKDRPTEDPVAARDAFMGFLSLLQTLLQTFGPLINNVIYGWSVDHAMPALVFFWTSFMSFSSLMFVTSVGFFVK